MTKADIPAGMRLKEIAGWNQTSADWERFLEASPEGCFVAVVGGIVCGTVATISYENRFAWIGMVLVDPEYRGRGFGAMLLEKAIEHLDSLRIPAIKLDATPEGKPLYEKLAFSSEYEIGRWTLRRTLSRAGQESRSGGHNSLTPGMLESIFTADRANFGADRASLLHSLHEDAPQLTISVSHSGSLEGYAFGRQGSFADHLGPWMASNPTAARTMLETFLARSFREVVIVDCLNANSVACNLLKSFGFSFSRPLTRMFRGTNGHPGRPEVFCAILGPEFG
jgi:GNAT superfamily N-acetyltransferase